MSRQAFEAAYVHTHRAGLFPERIEKAFALFASCTLCPRRCRVNRLNGELGTCRAGCLPEVSSYSPHFGEERPLVGLHGSGTIFLTHCNLRCSFCQNYSLSHLGEGREVSFERMARMMMELQDLGCHNINFVTPTHYVPQILKALPEAIDLGLRVPLVYNSSGYDSVAALKLLDGIFDIYMPDFKFARSGPAEEYCQAADYPEVARSAITEMHRQVGDLVLDERGIARRGLLVRHLVLPEGLAGTDEVVRFLAAEISPNTYVNIMDQYFPCGDIAPRSPLGRRITGEEFEEALDKARTAGLTRLDNREKHRLVSY
ncbi:MAG TPA: radical SAM protein [Candidatus Aminicenantes bacterium]|nr:radical SAM protein [Candidatus Aminicenantes bacterium]